MKLISLAEQKPTENDIGKTVFEILKGGKIKEHILNGQESYYYFDDLPILSLYFWSKPIIISEKEYEYLKTMSDAKYKMGNIIELTEEQIKQMWNEPTVKTCETCEYYEKGFFNPPCRCKYFFINKGSRVIPTEPDFYCKYYEIQEARKCQIIE